MDNKELIERLLFYADVAGKARKPEPADTYRLAAKTIAAQDARIAELEDEIGRLLAAQEANEFICRSCFRRHDPPRKPVAF